MTDKFNLLATMMTDAPLRKWRQLFKWPKYKNHENVISAIDGTRSKNGSSSDIGAPGPYENDDDKDNNK